MLKITNEDNMQLMARYEDNYFDLAIVDPPYGIGMHNQIVRVKPNRPNTYKNVGRLNYKKSNWDNQIPNKKYFDELFRVSKNQIIWGANYFCSYIPERYGWIFWDKQMGDNKFSAGEFAFQSIQIRSASFSYPSMRVKNTRIHPTQKPIKLYEWLLINYAKEGDKILDTHLGSGSIAIACHNLNFNLTACELDKEYFDSAMKRINNHKSQIRMF
jgi:site-specific DNA-methyltransferase (adenine-specific)